MKACLRVDVAMVDSRPKYNLGRFERIIGGEGDFQEKYTSLINGSLWAEDGADPVVQIVAFRASTAVWGWV